MWDVSRKLLYACAHLATKLVQHGSQMTMYGTGYSNPTYMVQDVKAHLRPLTC